jgi:hypothetical protein
MKKLTILTIMIVLLAFATPLMADVTVTGEVVYGVTLGPNSAADDNLTRGEKMSSNIKIVGKPDDNNTVTIILDVDELDDADADGYDSLIDKAYYESNLLSALGLGDIPVSVLLTGGKFNWANKDVAKCTGYEIEDVIDYENKDWQFGIDIGIMDMVTIRVGIDPDFDYQATAAGNSDTANIGYLLGAFGGAGPVMAEFFYTNAEGAPADEAGLLGAGVGVTLGFGDISIKVGADMSLNLADSSDEIMKYGAGVKFGYAKLISAGIGFYGVINDVNDSQAFRAMGINVDVNPIDIITIGAGVVLATYDGAESVLDRLDFMVGTKAGALVIELGYTFQPEDALLNEGVNQKNDLYPWNDNS